MTTTKAPEDVYNTSELSLVIDKADSIEEKDESGCSEMKMFSSGDIVIEEEESQELEEEARERKKSIAEMRKSFEIDDAKLLMRRPSTCLEASASPPTSISTQTIPTEEFPEVPIIVASINQSDDVRESAQSNVETQQETKIAQEIDSKAKSWNERDENTNSEAMVADDEAISSAMSAARCEKQQQRQERAVLLAHQHSMSQEDDFEVSMVSGLLPGCVAPAPTPAPSIAPLAEVELDPTEDDIEPEPVEPKPDIERKKKRKERKEKEGENQPQGDAEGSSSEPDKSKRNAVCPWEDE